MDLFIQKYLKPKKKKFENDPIWLYSKLCDTHRDDNWVGYYIEFIIAVKISRVKFLNFDNELKHKTL